MNMRCHKPPKSEFVISASIRRRHARPYRIHVFLANGDRESEKLPGSTWPTRRYCRFCRHGCLGFQQMARCSNGVGFPKGSTPGGGASLAFSAAFLARLARSAAALRLLASFTCWLCASTNQCISAVSDCLCTQKLSKTMHGPPVSVPGLERYVLLY